MKKLFLALALLACLPSCRSFYPLSETGVGRAWDHALFGAEPEYVEALQFLYRKTGRELAEKYEAAEAASVVDPVTGRVDEEWANRRFRLMEQLALDIRTWKQMADTVAKYDGVSLEGPVDEAQAAAHRRAREFLRSLGYGFRDAAGGILDE